MGEEGNNVIIDKVNQDFDVKGGTLRVVGLSDLGQPEGGTVAFDECYGEDRDNYIDIILVGDEDADLEPVIIALDDPMRIDYTPTVSN
jgi:hypothetical protein